MSRQRLGIGFSEQRCFVAPEVVGPVLVSIHGLLGSGLGLALVLALRLAAVLVAIRIAGAGICLLVGIGRDFRCGDGNGDTLCAFPFITAGKDGHVGVLLHGEQPGVLSIYLVARADGPHTHQMIPARQMTIHRGIVAGHGGLNQFGAGIFPFPLGNTGR